MNKPWISDELLFAHFLYLEHTLGPGIRSRHISPSFSHSSDIRVVRMGTYYTINDVRAN